MEPTKEVTSDETVVMNYGRGEHNLTISCAPYQFRVHREVLAQASEVWGTMLSLGFAESISQTITLTEDDPDTVRNALDIVYSLLSGEYDIDQPLQFDDSDLELLKVFCDKYSLDGVSSHTSFFEAHTKVKTELEQEKQRYSALCTQIVTEKEREVRRRVESLKNSRMKPGTLVSYFDRPPVGTRVVSNYSQERRGTIIANDEDGGTEIGVFWDDGSESHNLKCGKKGVHFLKYL